MRYAVGKRIQLANRGLELEILFVQRALVSLSLDDVADGILMQAGQFGGLFFKGRILLSRVGECASQAPIKQIGSEQRRAENKACPHRPEAPPAIPAEIVSDRAD